MKYQSIVVPLTLGILLAACNRAAVAKNELSEAEKQQGWVLLFDGKSLDQFCKDPKRGYHKWMVANGAITNRPAALPEDKAYKQFILFTVDEYDDYALSFDFHFGENADAGHSGAILKTVKPHDLRPSELTVSLFGPARKPGYFCTGAFRFHLKPVTKNAMKAAGQWNTMIVTVERKQVTVELNGAQVNELDMSQWTKPKRRPDGTPHILPMALTDLPDRSPIGFRDDYGIPIWLRNIKIRPLNRSN